MRVRMRQKVDMSTNLSKLPSLAGVSRQKYPVHNSTMHKAQLERRPTLDAFCPTTAPLFSLLYSPPSRKKLGCELPASW